MKSQKKQEKIEKNLKLSTKLHSEARNNINWKPLFEELQKDDVMDANPDGSLHYSPHKP